MRSALAALLVPLLSACVGAPEGVTPVSGFDAGRYLGVWHEIHRLDHSFERGLTDVTATYALRDDGRLSVVNRGWDPDECAFDSVQGVARFLDGPDTASLAVSFFGPFEGGYHVFALDREGYRWAAVAGPTRDYLWILARSPDLDPAVDAALRARAADLGFDVSALIRVPHGDPQCAQG